MRYPWWNTNSCRFWRIFVIAWTVFAINWFAGRSKAMAKDEKDAGGAGYYWHTPEHLGYSFDTDIERLFPWLEQYESIKSSFEKRNRLAFRFANLEGGDWWGRMALVAAEPDLGVRHREALVHLASASYTRLSGPLFFSNCLASRERRVVQGALILLPEHRTLRMDGRDSEWPADKLLDPSVLPYRVSRILQTHPALGVKVAQALAAYGSIRMRSDTC